jgi:tetratricopeptide (TPR) repeat protein
MSLEKNTFTLLWNQLFINYLVNSPNVDMNKLKRDMIEQCRLEYRDNQSQLKHIDEFNENCTQDNILNWYTSSSRSFAFRLVNRALRTRNIDLICKFRYFIILLHNKLKRLAIQQQQREDSTTVYRGQNLSKNDLENLRTNIGHLISVNTFMSTSRDKNVAEIFRGEDELSVLFEITITNASSNIFHPFADITELSSNTDEEEILFSAGAVFRVVSVEPGNDATWIIKLILSNESVQQIERLLDGVTEQLTYIKHWDHGSMKFNDLRMLRKYYKILTGNSCSLKDLITYVVGIDLYYLISVAGDHEKSIEFYKELLFNEKFIDHPKSVVANIMIGYNYFQLLQLDDALFYYEVALSSLDERDELKAEVYSHIGDVWRVRNTYGTALFYYEKALKILKIYHDEGRAFARTCRKVSNIYLHQNRYDEAIVYEVQADVIDEYHSQRSELDAETSLIYFQNQLDIPSDHPEIHRAETLYSMGLCLMKTNDYSQALEKFSEAKSLLEKHSPLSRGLAIRFVALYDSIALVHALLKDSFNALIVLKKAIDIRLIYFLS